METPRIETNRLLLRKIQEADVKDIFDCWMQDEDVSRYMCWKASGDIAETQSFVQFELEQIENEKWNRWIIELKETGRIIGTCLVFYNEDDDESHWDVSYNLGKKYWGNGYITEAMKEVMRFAEIELGMEECITTYAKANISSANVLHKLGFIDEAEISYECSGGDLITEGILCRYVSRDYLVTDIEFRKFTDFDRGIMYDILTDAYSFDERCSKCWDDNWKESDDFFFDNPDIADKYAFITCLEGNPIGFICWDPRNCPEYVEIGHNGIRAKYKGQGFGKKQLQEAIRRIMEYDGLREIRVCTNSNLVAPRNYESVGFILYDRKSNDSESAFSGDYLYYKIVL